MRVCRTGLSMVKNHRFAVQRYVSNLIPAHKELKFDTLVEMFVKTTQANATNYLFGTRNGNKFDWITYAEFEREVQKFRNVLHAHNFGPDDKLAIICNNRFFVIFVVFFSVLDRCT